MLATRRTSNGYRDYDEADLRVVRQIRSLVEIGFALEETRPFVECLRDGNETGDSCPASLASYHHKMREIEACIAELREAHDRLARQFHEAVTRHRLSAPEPACVHVPASIQEQP